MTEEIWKGVDTYLGGLLAPEDDALRNATRASADAELPAIQVSPLQGKLIMLLARMVGARRILEIGTLGGYSTIWLARALPPGGTLITLEIDPTHARVATENLRRAGVGERVEVRVGPALEMLPGLEREGAGPFDFIFIDADKPSNPEYLRWALRLSRPGTAILVDNVIRSGGILDEASDNASIQGTRALHELLGSHPALEATAVQTVGAKGYDGFALVRVRDASDRGNPIPSGEDR